VTLISLTTTIGAVDVATINVPSLNSVFGLVVVASRSVQAGTAICRIGPLDAPGVPFNSVPLLAFNSVPLLAFTPGLLGSVTTVPSGTCTSDSGIMSRNDIPVIFVLLPVALSVIVAPAQERAQTRQKHLVGLH